MENLNVPTEIISNIKGFVPRDKDMKSPTAELVRDSNQGWGFFKIQPYIRYSKHIWFRREKLFFVSKRYETYWNLNMFLNDTTDSDSDSDDENDI